MRILLYFILGMFSVNVFSIDYKIIDTDDIKKLIDTKADYVLVDSLTKIHYGVEHVPTAINIQNNQVKKNVNLLPKDKNKMLIFYCMGPKCFFSKNNAKQALELGYKNVYVWESGIPDWKNKGYDTEKGGGFLPMADFNKISPQKLKKNLNKVILVSLFSKKELSGIINNSKIINIIDFTQEYSKLPKDKLIVFYSLNGKIDKIAMKYLLSKGYRLSNLYFLDGGINAWKKLGLKIEK